MKGVRILDVPTEGRGDTNTVYAWLYGEGRGVRVFKRNAGLSAGSEYHTGVDPSKNPERFFVASGTVEFEMYDGITTETCSVREGQELQIDPWVWHASITKTDVVYLKPLQPAATVKDTYQTTKEEFRETLIKNGKL